MAHAGNSPAASTADREFVLTRLYEVPRALVWEAWTRPEHVEKWFGPTGYTTHNIAMEVRVGGLWRFTYIGPDGTVYRNRAEYTEIVPAERLVYWHGDDVELDPNRFHVTVTFADEAGGTRVTMHIVLKTAAQFEEAKKFGAIELGQSTLQKLADLLRVMPGVGGHGRAFEMTREFDAPRELVWAAFTDPAHLAQWWGPMGFKMLRLAMDLRPGGVFHYGMEAPDGSMMWGKWTFRDIVAPQRLVFLVTFSDESRGDARHPAAPEWPLHLLSTTTFHEHDGRTTMQMQVIPFEPTELERATFEAGFESMQGGFGGTYDQLVAYLARLRA